MNNYRNYLWENGYAPSTINGYVRSAERLIEWIEYTRQEISNINVSDLLSFKDHLVKEKIKEPQAINMTCSLSHYFFYLGWTVNPALLLDFNRRKKELPKKLKDNWTLQEMYTSVDARTPIQKRDKAMFGLFIFQGIKREELALIELEDLDIQNRKISVPGTRLSNTRILVLSKIQFQDLMHYLYDIRPELQKSAEKEETSFLFFSQGTGVGLNNALSRFSQRMKKSHPSFISLTNIRSSRISIWVKEEELPFAQYYSGIKYLNSMLRYHKGDLEALKKKVKIFHPMEGF